MKNALIILFIFVSQMAWNQAKNPDALFNLLKRKYAGVKDYTVDANIKVDVWFLKMPEKNVKIFYKFPDKVHIEAEGFAMLPKNASGFDPSVFISEKFTAVYIRSEELGNSTVDLIKTIPMDTEGDVILRTFWIDPQKLEIRKLEVNTKSGGTFQVDLNYNNLPHDLPQKLYVVSDMKGMDMPKTLTGEVPDNSKKDKTAKSGKGNVTITYSNYKVNTGLSDKIFEEKKAGKK